MIKEQIKKELSQYDNILKLINRANELKRAGEKEDVVNNVVAECRRKLLNKSGKVRRIEFKEVKPIDTTPIGSLLVHIESLQEPIVKYDGSTITI